MEDNSIKCELCLCWFHVKCGQMKSKKTIPLLHYFRSYCDDKNTLVKQLTNIYDLKAIISNDDNLTHLISALDKHENMLQSQSAQETNSGVGTAANENITAYIREERH